MKIRPAAVAQRQFSIYRDKLISLSMADRFAYIFQNNVWDAETSPSGLGSELSATAAIRSALPTLISRYAVKSLLDAPCGDTNWLKGTIEVDDYFGVDIVPEIIEENENKTIGRHSTKFAVRNICVDRLEYADLILCRDCLVHLSFQNIFAALDRFKESGAKFLLTTHFPALSR